PADHAQHVADRRAAGRGDDADLAREPRQLALARLIEEPLGLKSCLELLEGQLERSEPLGLQQLDHQLVLAALRVDLDAAERHHVQAVGRLELDAAAAIAKEHGADLRLGVLQGEVCVARAVEPEVRDLALDPDRRKALLERLLQTPRQLRNAQDRASRAHATPSWRSAARRVLRSSMAIVIGPTPPGTGVIARAPVAPPSPST